MKVVTSFAIDEKTREKAKIKAIRKKMTLSSYIASLIEADTKPSAKKNA